LRFLEIFAVKVAQPELVTATWRSDPALSAPERSHAHCRVAPLCLTVRVPHGAARPEVCMRRPHAPRAALKPAPGRVSTTPCAPRWPPARANTGWRSARLPRPGPFIHLFALKRSEVGYKGPPRLSPRASTRSSVHRVVSLCSSRRPQRPP
jgi:hypothetical protein